MYETLRSLNDLNRGNKRGIYKQWIYNSLNDFHLVCDYLQKINYSIQDINVELSSTKFGMKEIVYITSLTDWIKSSYLKTIEKIKKEIIDKFIYSRSKELKTAKDYFVAIRSYIVAHPMDTTKHEKFGLDGDFICVDLRTKDNPIMPFIQDNQLFYIDYYGFHKGKNKKHYYCLYTYSNSIDGNKYSKYISFDIKDIINVGRLYIDALYELDKYLLNIKKKDFVNNENE